MTRTPARRFAVATPWSDWSVLGIDPSLTGTGVALVTGGVLQKTEVLITDATAPRPARLASLRSGVAAFLAAYTPTIIAMETEAFGMPQQASVLGAVQGVLQMVVWEELIDLRRRIPGHYLPVNVSHVKKWLGVRQKNEILLAVYKRYGLTFSDHNAADATVIAMIADAYLARTTGHEWSEWTAPQREVLDKLAKTGYPWEQEPVKKVRKSKSAPTA